ncbi:MAG: zinc metallopeptidase [Eubacteriales bacterium]|nr:zinc metallopeptidase [Eubacteriales bacterium]
MLGYYGMYGMGFGRGFGYFDSTYFLVLIGLVISIAASTHVQSTYKKFERVHSRAGITAAEAALRILNGAGIYDVRIERISGNLTDNYDPRSKVLHLSDSTYNSTSVAAIGVAAHECGHAIQHDTNYAPLNIRGSLVPIVNIGSTISIPLIIIGVILSYNQPLITLGIAMFSLTLLFQLVTLPVEFDASGRALRILDQSGLLAHDEVNNAKKVLTAAALTYVAAAAATALQLLRLIILFGGRRRD